MIPFEHPQSPRPSASADCAQPPAGSRFRPIRPGTRPAAAQAHSVPLGLCAARISDSLGRGTAGRYHLQAAEEPAEG